MHKGFEFDIGYGFMDRTYLVDAEFACQDDPFETHVAQVCHLFGSAVVALRGSMQTDRGKVEVKQVQILNDKGIDTYFI